MKERMLKLKFNYGESWLKNQLVQIMSRNLQILHFDDL
uniref:Uncharacterized protein n=1 Tax=Manihot esculenta TaxID=3983 RepID=A0A2C9W7H8_MANES